VSASIPRGQDPATVTLAQAVELIAVRAAMGGGKKRRGGAAKRAPKVPEPVRPPANKAEGGRRKAKAKKVEA